MTSIWRMSSRPSKGRENVARPNRPQKIPSSPNHSRVEAKIVAVRIVVSGWPTSRMGCAPRLPSRTISVESVTSLAAVVLFTPGAGISCEIYGVGFVERGMSIAPWTIGWKMEEAMPLIYVVLTLIVVGMLLWLINTFIPMAGSIKSILNAVVVIVVCVWLLKTFGLWSHVVNYRLPGS
jgi:hypothetical protein